MQLEEDDLNDIDRLRHYPKNLLDFLHNKALFDKIKTKINISTGELFLLLLKFSVNNNLSMSTMNNLFKLVNTIFETPVLPESRHILDKMLNPKEGLQFHAVCPNCTAYVGKFGDLESNAVCPICHAEVDVKNPSSKNFFILIDPSKQISNLLNIYENHYSWVTQERVHKEGYIEDVYDGKRYRRFVQSLPGEEKYNYVSSVFNTDGASKFKSSKSSVWPLYLMLNELPAQDRMGKLVTCGLWFNKKKTEMPVFLDKFADLINEVTSAGIKSCIKGEIRVVKLHILKCCIDTGARSSVEGMKQFNGHFGCGWCLHPGVYSHGSMRYPLIDVVPKLREHEQTIELMLEADEENPVLGVKYPSPLIRFQYFDIIKSFIPDYLHFWLEGIAKRLSKEHSPLISDSIIEIMKKFAVPNQIGRLCRPLSERDDWNAREWENYILFYSAPILSKILPINKMEHWLLLAESLYILLQDKIHISELDKADKMLHDMVGKTNDLYGIENMTYNLHQALHVCNAVLDWGPLWCSSTFGFESANRYLLMAIKSANGVSQQIARHVNIGHSLLVVEEYVSREASDEVLAYCNETLLSKVQNVRKIGNVRYFGKGDEVETDILTTLHLSKNTTTFYSKIVKDGCLYESYSISKTRANNSFAVLKDTQYVRLHGFIVDVVTREEFTACNIVHTKNRFKRHFHKLQLIKKVENDISIVKPCDIHKVCVFMKRCSESYIIAVPNMLHY